jgi:hypothetical protein
VIGGRRCHGEWDIEAEGRGLVVEEVEASADVGGVLVVAAVGAVSAVAGGQELEEYVLVIGCKMLCKNPMVRGKEVHSCGQCMPCRINRRREWSHRIMLEVASHREKSAFITLTYNEKHLTSDLSVKPADLINFVRRFRYGTTESSRRPTERVRYFGAGEYGERFSRPHYHVAIFGHGSCSRIRTSNTGRCSCSYCTYCEQVWAKGNVSVGAVEPASAAYIAGYVTKKMTRSDDPRLNGRHPEFGRMSLRPGIGALFMDEVASAILEYDLEKEMVDVPKGLRHGNQIWPLDRYLRERLRERIGRDKKAPAAVKEEAFARLQNLHGAAQAMAPKGLKETYFRNFIVMAYEGKSDRLVYRKGKRNETF